MTSDRIGYDTGFYRNAADKRLNSLAGRIEVFRSSGTSRQLTDIMMSVMTDMKRIYGRNSNSSIYLFHPEDSSALHVVDSKTKGDKLPRYIKFNEEGCTSVMGWLLENGNKEAICKNGTKFIDMENNKRLGKDKPLLYSISINENQNTQILEKNGSLKGRVLNIRGHTYKPSVLSFTNEVPIFCYRMEEPEGRILGFYNNSGGKPKGIKECTNISRQVAGLLSDALDSAIQDGIINLDEHLKNMKKYQIELDKTKR